MLPLVSSWQRGLAPLLLLLLLGLARLAVAQAPSFDQAISCGEAQAINSNAGANAIATDAQGNTVVAGFFSGSVSFGSTVLTSNSGSNDLFIAKRTAGGLWLWAVSGGGSGNDNCNSVVTDALGQVYVTGAFGGGSGAAYTAATFGNFTLTSTGGTDVVVAKLDGATGQWLWATSAGAGTANSADERGTALAADAFGGLLLTGLFNDFRLLTGPLTLYQVGTGTNLFVAKLDAATGTWLWANNPGPANSNYLATDAQGSGYISGSFGGASLTLGSVTLTNPRVSTYQAQGFVAKYNADGSWVWATPLDATVGLGTTPGAGGASGGSLAADAQDHLYLCGAFRGATATFGATTLANASTTSQGPQLGSTQLGDAFVARLNARTGTWQWAVRAGGVDNEYFTRLVVRNGRVLVGGSFGRSANMFEPGTPSPAGSTFGTTTLVSAGKYDAVVACLTDIGTWEWAVRAGGSDLDDVTGLAVDAAGRAQILGYYYGPLVQFGSLSLPGSYDFKLLARLSGGTLPTTLPARTPTFALYPNPTCQHITISGLPGGQLVQVLDAMGRLVLTSKMPAQGPLLLTLTPGLSPGLYVVRAAGQARQLTVE